jgi:hypothetical protein
VAAAPARWFVLDRYSWGKFAPMPLGRAFLKGHQGRPQSVQNRAILLVRYLHVQIFDAIYKRPDDFLAVCAG